MIGQKSGFVRRALQISNRTTDSGLSNHEPVKNGDSRS